MTHARRIIFPLFIALTAIIAKNARATETPISLAGPWQFIRGGPALADHPGALPALQFNDDIALPATTDTAKKGPGDNYPSDSVLTQPYQFTGVCWYQREVTIPPAWHGKRVTLHLERTKYTQCWLDGKPVGENPICCTPQVYDLGSALTPGSHRITVAVDNKRLPPYGADAHQYSGGTQGNWNGIIGTIELRATDLTWMDDVQVYPNAADRSVDIRIQIQNASTVSVDANLSASVDGPTVSATAKTACPPGATTARLHIALGADAAQWDEFHPALHHVSVHLTAPGVDDQHDVTFGLRTFATRGRQFVLNGRPIFLRGKHDACVFPLTGRPPMDVDGWLRYLRTCQSYGLNHIRFHTWTPPDAAFTAADELGMYLQPELPFWGTFDQSVKDALEPEAINILRQFGNHPSFVMFSMGNEHWAGADVLASLVAELKAVDTRHLYVRGTNAFSYLGHPGKGDDYLITADEKANPNGPSHSVRGANAGTPTAQSHVQFGPPNTMADYSQAIAGATWPTVTHEMGQFTVYPDFKQIEKYTGVSRAHNYEHFRDLLKKAGMADQDAAFAHASGELAALCYREEIESCLRTPDYGGFELLDLQDYPGQGTAPVGILDAFMDSKGIITPEQWRQFCSPLVLLARFPSYVMTTADTFTPRIELAQYDDQDLSDAVLKWTLSDAAGHTLRSATLAAGTLRRGNVRPIGKLSIPLSGLTAPAQLRLNLSLVGTSVANQYPLWVYPPKISTTPAATVRIARNFDAATEAALAAGGRVLLVCDGKQPLANTVGGGFATDFWGVGFFHNMPGTEGLLCDPASAALSSFPTEAHSNWQWFDLATHAQPVSLDSIFPPTARPIVQVIDNYERCHRLGLVFEAKVGAGKLLVCATDAVALSADHPEARQLLSSLLAYANSDRFNPATPVSTAALRTLFETRIDMTGAIATASSYDKRWQNYSPANLIDGNDAKPWMADKDTAGDCWCKVEFPAPTDVGSIDILWGEDSAGDRFTLERSTDGVHWEPLPAELIDHSPAGRPRFRLDANGLKYLKLAITATPSNKPAAINELRFFPPR